MKLQYLFILIILCLNLNSIKTATICIQGENCPNKQGFCIQNECVCVYRFQTLLEIQNTTSPKYCNYQQKNRIIPLILEFLFPPIGLFYLGRIKHAILKIILLVMMCICIGLKSSFTLISLLLFFGLQIVDLFRLAFGSMYDGYGFPIL